MRVLYMFTGVFWSRDEGTEIRELLAGLIEATSADASVVVRVSDGDRLYRPSLTVDGSVQFDDVGEFAEAVRNPPDVVWAHMVIQPQLLRAVTRLRAKRVPVLLAPMSMLGDDFASASWFKDASLLESLVKPAKVRALRAAWNAVTTVMAVVSANEAAQAHLSPQDVVLAPLPIPHSPLADAASSATTPPDDDEPAGDGPVAIVSRFDVHRKGFDRLVDWIEAHADALPRPALLLLAGHDDNPPEAIPRLIEAGLIEWDSTTRGADLLPRLRGCRGTVLLSRFEAMPRSLRESAVAGIPVLATTESNWTEVVETLGTGCIVDGDDPDDVMRGFATLPDMPRRGATALRLFDRARLGAFYAEVLRDLAHGRQPRQPNYYATFRAST